MTGNRLPPFGPLRVLSLEGREAEASALIAATIDQSTARGQGMAVRVAEWAAAVLYNGIGRYSDAAEAAHEVTANDIDPYPQMWALPNSWRRRPERARRTLHAAHSVGWPR